MNNHEHIKSYLDLYDFRRRCFKMCPIWET